LVSGLALEFFRGSVAQRRVQPLPIVILLDELFDVGSYLEMICADFLAGASIDDP